MYILNIETATKNCSVGLSKNGKALVIKEFAGEGFSHAELLHVFIEEVLTTANIDFKDLMAIAVSKGPGSYTGLRIGISAAKGLCFALDIPLISVDTLTILARQVQNTKGLIVPMIDARRMEVYSAVFDSHFNVKREIQAEIIDESSYSNVTENIYIVGDCQEKIKTVLKASNFIYLDTIIYPSANEMCLLSFEKYNLKDFENVAYFEPNYLKEFLFTAKKA